MKRKLDNKPSCNLMKCSETNIGSIENQSNYLSKYLILENKTN